VKARAESGDARAPEKVPLPVVSVPVPSVEAGAVIVPVPVADVLGELVVEVVLDVEVVDVELVDGGGEVVELDVVVDEVLVGDGVPCPSPPASLCRTWASTGRVRPSTTTEPALV
jgi:hypothetical protein